MKNLVIANEELNNWCGTKDIKYYESLDACFKYAVPIAIDKIMAEHECSSDVAYAILFEKWLQKLQCDIPNYEGTLFWAIYEAMHHAN